MTGSPKGIPIKEGWWKRPLSDFNYQMDLCKKCSACLPMPMKANDKQEWDDVSLGNVVPSRRSCKVYDIESLREYYKGHTFTPETDYDKRGYFKDFPNWRPNKYRDVVKHTPT